MKTLSLILIIGIISFNEGQTKPSSTHPSIVSTEEVQTSIRKSETIGSIKNHITSLIPLKEKTLNTVALSIYSASEKFEIDPHLMISLIMTESSFNHKAISSTGDISIVQINMKVWGKESQRLGFPFDPELIKDCPDYAIHAMAQILKYLKGRYAHKDPIWFATYHSKTCRSDFCPKKDYAKKVLMKMPTTVSSVVVAKN